jgi:hypothetical protein
MRTGRMDAMHDHVEHGEARLEQIRADGRKVRFQFDGDLEILRHEAFGKG